MMNKGREGNLEMDASVKQLGVVSSESIANAIIELLQNDQASSVFAFTAKHGYRYPFPAKL